MRFLVLGSSGFLGSYLGLSIPRSGHEVAGVSRSTVPYFPHFMQERDSARFTGVIDSGSYDVVINCVAVASHEKCEADPDTARAINATFPGLWASAAKESGARFVHISTDAVFDGSSADRYAETDEAAPGSVYGATKLEGEHTVLDANPDAVILRTNFFGWSQSRQHGILDFFAGAFSRNVSVTGFQDYVVSSLYMGDLSDVILEMSSRSVSGIYHAVSSTPLSKFDFALAVAEAGGLSADSLSPGLVSEAPGLAPRGHDLSLSTAKIEQVVGRSMPSTREGLDRAFAERSDVMDYFGQSAQ